MTVTFDLFGTLVTVQRAADGDPTAPARAVAAELAGRDIPVPEDWPAAYRERHVDAAPGAEVSLPVHVAAALESRGVSAPTDDIRLAVLAAFDTGVETRPGAHRAVSAAAERGPVGVLSNCAVPGLAGRALGRSTLDTDAFDAVVTSVGCGWRKPDRRAFAAAARRLDADPGGAVHVGDDPRTDGGIEDASPGGSFVDVADVALADLPAHLEAGCH